MRTKIFINLAVTDVRRSMAFFKALGYSHNPQFTDETAACIVISEEIYVMVLTHAKFREFAPKGICDTTQFNEALLTLSCESRQAVDDLVAKAVAAGATTFEQPTDHGFMYSHSFIDLDGHGWGLFHMNGMPPK